MTRCEGTILISFPVSFPILKEGETQRLLFGGNGISVIYFANETIKLAVDDIIELESGIVRFSGMGIVSLCLRREVNGKWKMNIQGIVIENRNPNDCLIVVSPISPRNPSLLEPGIVDVCGEWIAWRKDRFSSLGDVKMGRVESDRDSLLASLDYRLKVLDDFITRARQGDQRAFEVIATIVRNLVVWTNSKRHVPLLLYIANWHYLPLPIWVQTNNDLSAGNPDVEALMAKMTTPLDGNRISIYKISEKCKLMDIQSWMELNILLSDPAQAFMDVAPRENYLTQKKILDLIRDVADTSSLAHVDITIPLNVEEFKKFHVNGSNILNLFFLQVGMTIHLMGISVLAVCRNGNGIVSDI